MKKAWNREFKKISSIIIISFSCEHIIKNKTIFANGGRVLNFVKIFKMRYKSRTEVIEKIEKLDWKNGFYRSDIGFKVTK